MIFVCKGKLGKVWLLLCSIVGDVMKIEQKPFRTHVRTKNIFAVVPPFRFRKRNVSGLSYTLCVYSDNMKKPNKAQKDIDHLDFSRWRRNV